MTRKHYKLIAEALRNAKPSESAWKDDGQYGAAMAAWEHTCREVSGALRETSALYDRNRFLEACGVESV